MQRTYEHKMSGKSLPLIISVLTCCNMSIDETKVVDAQREKAWDTGLLKDALKSGSNYLMSIKYKKTLLYITFACRHFPLHHSSMLTPLHLNSRIPVEKIDKNRPMKKRLAKVLIWIINESGSCYHRVINKENYVIMCNIAFESI